MNRLTFAAVLASLTLAGCASLRPGATEPIRSDVTFDDGKIGLTSPVVLVQKGSEATVVWQLPSGKDVTFPDNGIVIEGAVVFPSETVPEPKGQPPGDTASLRIDPQQKSNFMCALQEDRLKIACSSKRLVPGVYKYTIRVLRRDGQVLKVDPPMVIM